MLKECKHCVVLSTVFHRFEERRWKASILHEETTKELQIKRSRPFAVKKNLPTPYSSKEENIGYFLHLYSMFIDKASKYGGLKTIEPNCETFPMLLGFIEYP